MKLKYRRRALADLRSIRDYIAQSDPAAAERVRQHLVARIQRLTRKPDLGLPSEDDEIRILFPTLYPYRIYFTVQADTIVILHVRHTSRRQPNPGSI